MVALPVITVVPSAIPVISIAIPMPIPIVPSAVAIVAIGPIVDEFYLSVLILDPVDPARRAEVPIIIIIVNVLRFAFE